MNTLVVDVDEQGKFKKFVDRNNEPLFGDRWKTLVGAMVSFHGEATADGVRHGRDRGKLIFTFDGGPDHPLCRVGSKWKKPRGIEVFYGNGLPSILGQYGDDGDQYRLEGTLGKAPDWLVESLTPRQSKQTRCRERVPTMNPAEQREALTGLPLLLAELCPELGNPSVGWRLKDFSGELLRSRAEQSGLVAAPSSMTPDAPRMETWTPGITMTAHTSGACTDRAGGFRT